LTDNIKISQPYINSLLKNPVNCRQLIDEIPFGVLILDLDRRVVLFNRTFEALSGFSLINARGMHCQNILRSAACIKDCPVFKITPGGRAVSLESDMINLDRQHFPIRITTAHILNSHGKPCGFIETIEDMRASQTSDIKQSIAYSFANIIGRSRQMEKIFQTLPVLAQSDASVLITGETGTGKDLVAEAMHQTSERAAGPFIKINCGALPETLLESEIFGHQKGAFTGAVENKPGRFRLAHNGTIFLTEIGDLPLSLQVKLLTFLDDKIIFPLGSTKGFKVNVRIITATHRNLEQMVQMGKFRKDLLFRLNVARIHLPPLREREGDIRLLLDYFFNKYKNKLEKKITGFSKNVLSILQNFNYEGNIRELKNIVEYSVNITNNTIIGIDDLPAYIQDTPQTFLSQSLQDGLNTKDIPLENTIAPQKKTWASTEKQIILNALIQAKGKKITAAKILGMGRSTLWRKIKLYELE